MSFYHKSFAGVQANILKGAGDYTKTRYGIITFSLQNLINTEKEFAELLLFICLLDYQDIPRDFLDKFKNNLVVDNFIYNLKKYSLVTIKPSLLHLGSSLAIHKSTQEISLAYLIKILSLEKKRSLFDAVVNVLENFTREAIEQEDYSKMNVLKNHLERFLTHRPLLNERIQASIGCELGGIYFHLGHYPQAKQVLVECIANLNKGEVKDYSRTAQALENLGNVYRYLGDFEKSKNLLEESLVIYKKHFPENYIGVARTLVYLGNVYKNTGNYEKAKDVLVQSLVLYKQHLSDNHHRIAWVLDHLGNIYRELGEYEKARELLEESLVIYRNQFSDNHIRIAQALVHLGMIYRELGHYEKAKNVLEESVVIYKKQFSENHVGFAWALAHLGNVHRNRGDYEKAKALHEQNLSIQKKHFSENHIGVARARAYLGNVYRDSGDYKKARDLLEQSLLSYEKSFSKDHIETARVRRDLGETYFLEGHLEHADDIFKKTLEIFQQKNHPERYISLESLTDLYLKKSTDVLTKGDRERSKIYKKQGCDYGKQALEILKANFPKESPHISRMESKLRKLE